MISFWKNVKAGSVAEDESENGERMLGVYRGVSLRSGKYQRIKQSSSIFNADVN